MKRHLRAERNGKDYRDLGAGKLWKIRLYPQRIKLFGDRLVDGHSMCKHSEIVGKNGVLDTVKPWNIRLLPQRQKPFCDKNGQNDYYDNKEEWHYMEEKQQETADKKTLRQEIPVYSEKYGVHGKVLDYGVVTKLVFNYDGKDLEVGMMLYK